MMLLLSPAFYLLLSLLYIFYRIYSQKSWRSFFLTWLITAYLFSTPFLLHPAITWLEDYSEPLSLNSPALQKLQADSGRTVHIYICGGGQGYDSRLSATQLLGWSSAVRLLEGIRLHHLLPNSILITSANSPSGNQPQAITLKKAAIELGVDSNAIFTNPLPYDTESEAKTYVEQWGTENPVIVVTSAIHQRRALAWFEKAGVPEPIGAPAHFIFKRDNPKSWRRVVPSLENLLNWNLVIKEYVGFWEVGL